jgi:alpha-1,6-mannosyltransferase
MIKNTKQILISLSISIVMTVLYWHISFKTPSEYFFMFISQYFLLFALFLLLIKVETNFKRLLGFAIVSRILLVFSVPELSPDFYRFIWDGELLTQGINPYAHVPNDLISFNGFYDSQYMRSLYNGCSPLSQGNYSNYPVLNQVLFFIPAFFFDTIQENVISLKLFLLLADIGAIFFLKKILDQLKLPIQKLWMYALNPFILIEFVGNMHFEGVMIFFMLGAVYFVLKRNWITGGVLLGLSIQIKLIPLMLIPFFFKHLKWRKAIGFTAVLAVVVILLGKVLWSDQLYVDNMMTSIEIYFTTFEFNSSLFGIVNHFKTESIGWNATYIVGPLLSKIAAVFILILAVFRNYKDSLDIIKGMLFALVIYYLFATTIHPWYISMILVLSLFTNYKFGLIWTMLVPLSYSFYVLESGTLLLRYLEYIIIFGVLIYEIVKYWDKGLINLNFKRFFSS